MEDQGKRLLLAVAIAFGLLWLWSILFPNKPPEKKPEGDEAAQVEKDKPDTAETKPDQPEAPEVVADKPEETVRFELGESVVVLSTHGAALKSWTLTDPQLEDRRQSPPVPLELAPTAMHGAAYYPLQITLADEGPLAALKTASWEIDKKEEHGVVFRWENETHKVFKKYKFNDDSFFFELTIDVLKKSSGSVKHALTVVSYGFQDLDAKTGGGMTRMPREWKAACLVGEDVKTKSAKDLQKKPQRRDGDIRWGGFLHSYFATLVAPEHEAKERLECDSYGIEAVRGAMRVEITYPEVLLDQGDVFQRKLYGYYGPKRVSVMQTASHEAKVDSKGEEFNPHFEEAVDFGWLSIISGPLLWLLKIFQGFVVNWGLAIILLTLVIKLLVLPWTHKSIKSMKAMSKLRPQMEKLKEKYADDKQRQQVEMMNLFKSHGVNPLAGCLPMLLQMPIWFALYRMLMKAAELYQAPFIPGYINDLTAPDPFYILPVLVTGLMFFQTRLTPTTATGFQQKLLMYGMPLMFGFFSIWFPAGLTLYIFTNTCLTLTHHFFVHREDRQRMAAEKKSGKAAVATAVDDDDDGDDDADLDRDDEPEEKPVKKKSGGGAKSKPKKKKNPVKGSVKSVGAASDSSKSASGNKNNKNRGKGRNRSKKGKKKGGRK